MNPHSQTLSGQPTLEHNHARYDALSRLTFAVTAGSTGFPAWGLSETYDRYGNRSAQSVYSGCSGVTCPTNSVTVSATTNRISGSPYSYDASGNMTNDGYNTLVYDAENRVLSATNGSAAGSYTYDGNSLRVKKVSGSTATVYIFSGSKVIAEYDNGAVVGSPSREYIYSGGALLAKIDSTGTKYYHQDHLSNRLVTDSSGNTVTQMGHYPFGESWYNASNDKLQFTSYERDSESLNDYALMRSYINRLARFSSPDPLAGSIGNPQSLNKYSYTSNDSINFADPKGLFRGYRYAPAATSYLDIFEWAFYSVGGEEGGTFIDPAGLAAYFLLSNQGGSSLGGGILGEGPLAIGSPPPPPGYEKCITAALEAMIAHNEGTDIKPNGGYGSLANGMVTSAPDPLNIFVGMRNVQIPNPGALSGHPGIHVQAGQWNTTAFGRYQILGWVAATLGPGGTPWTNFSPAGQDAAAAMLMNGVGMVQDAMAGQIVQAIWDGNTTWASLPDSPYGQPTWSWAATIGAFQNALNTLPECK